MKKNKKATKTNPYGFKNHSDAWQKAEKEYPPTKEMLARLIASHSYPLETKNDVRFFVLFNHIRHIAGELDRGLEHAYLERIQDNILLAAERFMK
jgi:6-pyruvoyl-tetrahydropterin synthase